MAERSGKSMSTVDGAKIWSLNYRVLLSVISCAEAGICALGLESKELFLLAEIDPSDLRRHRLLLTAAGRQAATSGLALLSDEFNKRLGRLTAAQQKDLTN